MNNLLKSILIVTAVVSTFSLTACQKAGEEPSQQNSSEVKPASQVDDTVVVTASEVTIQK